MMSSQQGYEPVSTSVGADDGRFGTDLSQSLTRPEAVPRATASTALMEVTAPATLPEGYVFKTTLGDRVIQVTVPPGGVEEGQRFTAPLPTDVESAVHRKIQIPVGHWRDGLFCGNLCNYGVCHPHCWTACCCTTSKYLLFHIRKHAYYQSSYKSIISTKYTHSSTFSLLLRQLQPLKSFDVWVYNGMA